MSSRLTLQEKSPITKDDKKVAVTFNKCIKNEERNDDVMRNITHQPRSYSQSIIS